jgi:hypothetical protein
VIGPPPPGPLAHFFGLCNFAQTRFRETCETRPMDEISFHRLKAEQCARLAKDEPDTGRRLELEDESALWLKLACAEEHWMSCVKRFRII